MAEIPASINNYVLPAINAIARRPVSSHFFENISPVTPISGPLNARFVSPVSIASTKHPVSPVSTASSLHQESALEIATETSRSRSPPPYRTASSTGFTAPYHVVGNNDEQYRFEKPQTRRRRIPLPNWRFDRHTINLHGRPLGAVIGLVLSIISLVVIVIVLHEYHGKVLTDWPHSITPNSFLAVFITLAQAGLMVPIVSLLLHRNHLSPEDDQESLVEQSSVASLSDTVTSFSKHKKRYASALLSLANKELTKISYLTSIGTVLSFFTLTIAPTTQQILTFPIELALINGSALPIVPKSNIFSSYNAVSGSVGLPDLKMQQAIKSAIFNPANESVPAISPTCESGNCEFPSFTSLAICSRAADISSYLSITPTERNMSELNELNVTLPNGAYLTTGQLSMDMSSPLAIVNGRGVAIANHSIAFSSEPDIVFTAISDYFIIFQNSSSTENSVSTSAFGAIEVMTYWCVNTYSISVEDGVTTTLVDTTSTNVLSETAQVVNGTSIQYGELVLTADGGSERFTVDGEANQVLAEYMAKTFSGYCVEGEGEKWSSDAAMAVDGILETGGSQLLGVQTFADNIAVVMTNVIRSLNASNAVLGSMYESLAHIRVAWGWLSLLVLVIVSTIVVEIVTYWSKGTSSTRMAGSKHVVLYRSVGAVRIAETPDARTVAPVILHGGNGEANSMISRNGRGHERAWSLVTSVSADI